MADEQVRIDLVADDKASAKIDDVADKVDQLDHADPTVTVGADTRDAQGDVDAFADRLNKLTDADKLVVLALRAGAAQTELKDIATELATIDAADPTVDVKLDRYAELTSELDALDSKMKGIADTSIDPDVGGKAKARFESVTEEAGKAGDAVHSMAGNAIGDFAATTTGIGPLGEAIGQLTEGVAGAEVNFKQLASAGLQMGGIAAAMFEISQYMSKIADVKAFNADQVSAFAKALGDGATAAEALQQHLADAGKIEAPQLFTAANPFASATQDVTASVVALGLTLQQYTSLVDDFRANGDQATESMKAWAQAQVDAGANMDDLNKVMTAITTSAKNLDAAEKAQAVTTKFFADTAADDYLRQIDAMNNKTRSTTTTAELFTDRIGDAARAVNDLTGELESMSGQIDRDQSLINLSNQLANVQQAAKDAMDAQAEADKARASGAKDSAEKTAAAEQAMRDYQTSINDAKQAIIQIGETAGATPVDVDSTIRKLTSGDLNGVKSDAEAYYNRNPVQMDAELRVRLLKIISAGVGAPVALAGTSTVHVTQMLPRGYRGDALGDAQRAAARSGGLYRRLPR